MKYQTIAVILALALLTKVQAEDISELSGMCASCVNPLDVNSFYYCEDTDTCDTETV